MLVALDNVEATRRAYSRHKKIGRYIPLKSNAKFEPKSAKSRKRTQSDPDVASFNRAIYSLRYWSTSRLTRTT